MGDFKVGWDNATLLRERVTEEAPPRDLEAELREKRITARTAPMACPGCGDVVERHKLRSHMRKPLCAAGTRANALIAAGFKRVTHYAKRAIQAAGLPLRYENTGYRASRKHQKAAVIEEAWVVAWIVDFFYVERDQYMLFQSPDRDVQYSEDEIATLYGNVLREAHEHVDMREAIDAVTRLGGWEARRSLAFTPTVRASKMRARANEYVQSAVDLERRAAELEPKEASDV